MRAGQNSESFPLISILKPALTVNVFLQTGIIVRVNPNNNWAPSQITVLCMAAHNQQQPQAL